MEKKTLIAFFISALFFLNNVQAKMLYEDARNSSKEEQGSYQAVEVAQEDSTDIFDDIDEPTNEKKEWQVLYSGSFITVRSFDVKKYSLVSIHSSFGREDAYSTYSVQTEIDGYTQLEIGCGSFKIQNGVLSVSGESKCPILGVLAY